MAARCDISHVAVVRSGVNVQGPQPEHVKTQHIKCTDLVMQFGGALACLTGFEQAIRAEEDGKQVRRERRPRTLPAQVTEDKHVYFNPRFVLRQELGAGRVSLVLRLPYNVAKAVFVDANNKMLEAPELSCVAAEPSRCVAYHAKGAAALGNLLNKTWSVYFAHAPTWSHSHPRRSNQPCAGFCNQNREDSCGVCVRMGASCHGGRITANHTVTDSLSPTPWRRGTNKTPILPCCCRNNWGTSWHSIGSGGRWCRRYSCDFRKCQVRILADSERKP